MKQHIFPDWIDSSLQPFNFRPENVPPLQLQNCKWRIHSQYRFITWFYGLADMPAASQKLMD